MAFNLPPPPVSNDPKDPAFRDWFYKLQKAFSALGSFLFTNLDFTGSNITSIATRNHADLQNLNTASYTHLTATQATDLTDAGDSTLHYHASDRDSANFTGTNWTDLTDSGATTLHKHDHSLQDNLNSTSYYHLTNAEYTDLTDGGASTAHYHTSDRDLANATGTLDETLGGTGNTTYTTGDILYASASNTLSKLGIGTSGQGLIVSAGVPAWGNITSQVKVYEPTVIAGFDPTYTTIPAFVTTTTGDIVMAWGGSYAT